MGVKGLGFFKRDQGWQTGQRGWGALVVFKFGDAGNVEKVDGKKCPWRGVQKEKEPR